MGAGGGGLGLEPRVVLLGEEQFESIPGLVGGGIEIPAIICLWLSLSLSEVIG